MTTGNMLEHLKGGLVVSCQALKGEPLHGALFMSRMALAAAEGGAVGIIANGPKDILAIKREVDLPIIGVMTQEYADSPISLTPTLVEINAIAAAGAEMAGLDATGRQRPCGENLVDFVTNIRQHHPHLLLMAEISTVEEALRAQDLGFDCISSAAYGFTESTVGSKLPKDDFAHLKSLRSAISGGILVAEGGISSPEQAARALELGADIVVVGSAITRPQFITQSFAGTMRRLVGSVSNLI